MAYGFRVAGVVRQLREQHEFLRKLDLSEEDFRDFATRRALDEYERNPELFQDALKRYIFDSRAPQLSK